MDAGILYYNGYLWYPDLAKWHIVWLFAIHANADRFPDPCHITQYGADKRKN